ncbi:major facilitator superfamily transporter multidrug resistance [Pleomassaria siparia CBS 279.74]|uniref:Major facilitator superfamily transporter multidrug resistance n=1 Tax=Pleomassaria siparia CBS 279.74 TaxID=1314801 RepID=A0A6G1K730_9PLEO|nr:major facilitator superfamily transporter multidrug resistance [Pleomassaria siparia CBS 279.74]
MLPEQEWIRTSQGTVGRAIGSVSQRKVVDKEDKEQPYHVFERNEKWTLVVVVGLAGLFPGLTANVYLPTLNAVASDFTIGLDRVTLTIMTYFIAQGFASLLWGVLADSLGRRSVYIYSFVIYIIANIVLSFSPNLATLVVFRGIQAAAIASTVQGTRNYTIVLAPIIGGLLSNYMNFRSIFLFLLGFSIAALVVILLFLPETHRSIAGNGTWPVTGIHQSLIWKFKYFGKSAHVDEQGSSGVAPPLVASDFIAPLALLKEKDIVLSLLFNGAVFAISSMVLVSTAGLFQGVFGLNEALLGLVFIPSGLGTIVGSILMGKLLNRDFHAFTSTYKAERSLPPLTIISRSSLPAYFPLEQARLVRLPMVIVIFIIALSFYGFTLSSPALTSRPGFILVPLLLQFFIAATASAVCAIYETFITDLWPKNQASSAAVSNLVRCLFAALGVALVQLLIKSVGVGPVFLALGLVVMTFVPLPIVQWYWGGDWRRERDGRGPDTVDRHVLEKV